MRKYHERDFPDTDYDKFYQSHYFAPVSDEDAINAHKIFPRVAWALDIAREIKPKAVLDLGCLEGYALLTIARHVGIEQGEGVDLSEDGIKLAITRAKKYGLKCGFTNWSIEDYLDGCPYKFDLIMAFEVMEHVKNPELVFKLIDEVLAPGGTVLISTPAFESPTYGKDDEQNKCHVRLYTTKDEDYEEINKYGNMRTASSLSKQIGKSRIKEMSVFSELIHARYC